MSHHIEVFGIVPPPLPIVDPVQPIRRPTTPQPVALPPEVTAPHAPPVDVIHAEHADGPAPEMPHEMSDHPTTAGRLHHTLGTLDVREKAASMVAQGVPPLVLDPQRAHDASDSSDDDESGEARLRVEAAAPRKRRRRRPSSL